MIGKKLCQNCTKLNLLEHHKWCLALERTIDSVEAMPTHCLRYECKASDVMIPFVDVVVLCATETERLAILTYLHPRGVKAWSSFKADQDGRWVTCIFHEERSGTAIRIAMTKALDQGMSAMSSLCTAAIFLFRPRYVALLGIAAGRDGKVKIGDVLISSSVSDYGYGRWEEVPVKGKPPKIQFRQRILERSLSSFIRGEVENSDHFREFGQIVRVEWQDAFPDGLPFGAPQIVVGQTVSGAAVVDSEKMWAEIIERNDKVIGLDMEAFGFAYAAESNGFKNSPKWLVAKSVCDFGKDKKKDAQAFAAFTSARFFREFLCLVVSEEIESEPARDLY